MHWLLYHILKIVGILTLPFILLVRGSVYVHGHYGPGARLSIIAGILITALLLLVYIISFHRRVAGSVSGSKSLKSKIVISLLLVLGFAINSLYFISDHNFKNASLKEEIRAIHPILRLSIGTLLLVDKDVIITDTKRLPEDYKRMGLPSKKASLHYKQPDGYAYAIDLRTNGHHEIRNTLMKWYFQLMGFNTLRHGGTGDHLHVSISCPYHKGSI